MLSIFTSILASINIYMMNNLTREHSKNDFHTDIDINGEFFRSKTKNQYFCVMNKNIKQGELSNFSGDFRSLDNAIKTRSFYNPEKHNIVRLEFKKNKSYFVESYQAISIINPDVIVINIPLEELLLITPKFEPLPHE